MRIAAEPRVTARTLLQWRQRLSKSYFVRSVCTNDVCFVAPLPLRGPGPFCFRTRSFLSGNQPVFRNVVSRKKNKRLSVS